MKFYRSLPLMLPLLGATSQATIAAEVVESAPLIVTATRHEFSEVDAPYPAELYSYEDIAQSGATTLYDFLNHNTSITVMPSFGNPFAQKIDMRGYGIGDGYQNIVVTVDGRRLNNIDMGPQLLSTIPLSSIERIEITKGSGSVVYGDGATAGAIHIHTRNVSGLSTTITSGNYGKIGSSISAGITEERLSLAVTADSFHQDGFGDPDVTGQRDSSNSDNLHTMLTLLPTDTLEVRLLKDRSRIDTRYPGALTEAELDANPAQNGGNTYTYQQYATDHSGVGVTADLSDHIQLNIDHTNETKHSDYNSGGWVSDYDYTSNDLALTFDQGNLNIVTGWQHFDGARSAATNTTYKRNSGYYLQGHYTQAATIFSLGGRQERVDYTYDEIAAAKLSAADTLQSYDLGVNHRYSQTTTLFGNYNLAFQAPDIDRFFNWGGTFNTFIDPAIVRTLNIGLNHTRRGNRFKITLFRADLENEIYYESTTWTNTNIDRSHKYGVEIEESHDFGGQLTGALNYTFTRAIIDSEAGVAGAYDGKDLPGVPNHTTTVSVSYRPSTRSTYHLNHTYRSDSYAANDFANDLTQKQRAFNSTDVGYSYQMDKTRLSIKITNLLNQTNGLWISDDQIYPVNFTRNIELGLKVDL